MHDRTRVPSWPAAANGAICMRIVQVRNRLHAWRGRGAESQIPRRWDLAHVLLPAFIPDGSRFILRSDAPRVESPATEQD